MLKIMDLHLKDVEGSRPEQLSHVIEGTNSTDGFRDRGRGFKMKRIFVFDNFQSCISFQSI